MQLEDLTNLQTNPLTYAKENFSIKPGIRPIMQAN